MAEHRQDFWGLLRRLHKLKNNVDEQLVLGGNFNELLFDSEKKGVIKLMVHFLRILETVVIFCKLEVYPLQALGLLGQIGEREFITLKKDWTDILLIHPGRTYSLE